MKYQPIITNKSIIFHLNKAIYGSFYAIWDKWLKIAKERNLTIVVNTKEGTVTYTYKTYMDGAKKLERYYKNPNIPMIFYGRDILPDVKKREERKKVEKKVEVSGGLWAYLENLKEKKPEEYYKLKEKLNIS
uniref:Uncharacterized protein n=1 Tax=candidate division CPR3 bacterium TaxID=2268181 RepID=A0A7C5URM5_UNCC3